MNEVYPQIITHLDEDRNGEAREVQQRLYIHEVRRRHQLEEQGLINLHELGVPALDYLCDDVRLERRGDGRHFKKRESVGR